ncbi:hypothetical protein GPECTOR_33g610 [Gonium pectorale]|uniref:O-fucosyltransferase family protein n=1 Tax=Gonium pectorale TaxID=33097 RepID=A0A150GD40_GONPE|nr:hypothetical protein GPECTOR_33g610 [Gonium pectorale]|eukprot:KXZ47728.1 hypothetical protein GPECTOR_33g610 [Gonium pectorale]
MGLIKEQGFQGPPEREWIVSPVTSWDGCTEDRIAELRKLIAPYKVVGVQTFHGLLYGSQWLAGPLLVPCRDTCCRVYKELASSLRKSQLLFDMADRFIRERLGGIQFVPSIKHLMAKYRTNTTFVMCHPKVRSVVQSQLRRAGVEPLFMDLKDINSSATGGSGAMATNVSYSLLAMVEEAVCIRAKAFVGTKESSMTGTIVQERLGHGVPPEDSYSFFGGIDYETRPIDVPAWYKRPGFNASGTDKWRQMLAREKGLKLPQANGSSTSTRSLRL